MRDGSQKNIIILKRKSDKFTTIISSRVLVLWRAIEPDCLHELGSWLNFNSFLETNPTRILDERKEEELTVKRVPSINLLTSSPSSISLLIDVFLI